MSVGDTDDELLVLLRGEGGDAVAADDTALEEADDDGGFSDAVGAVRLWFEDRRLVQVRLSPDWAARLPPGAALEDCFRQAFLVARAMTGIATPEPAPEQGISALEDLPEEVRQVLEQLPRLDTRALAACLHLMEEVEVLYALECSLESSQEESFAPEGVSGTSAGVTVRMTSAGFPDRVEFDQGWLEDQHTGSICSHVMAATEKAAAAYVAMTVMPEKPSGLEDLRQERELLRAAYFALLTPRGML